MIYNVLQTLGRQECSNLIPFPFLFFAFFARSHPPSSEECQKLFGTFMLIIPFLITNNKLIIAACEEIFHPSNSLQKNRKNDDEKSRKHAFLNIYDAFMFTVEIKIAFLSSAKVLCFINKHLSHDFKRFLRSEISPSFIKIRTIN